MSNHAYVCRPCGLFYDTEKNGVYVEEMAPVRPLYNGAPLPGEDIWKPYKILAGDLLKCPGCGHELISGFGRGSIAEHHEPTYAATRARLQPIVQIKDC